MKKASAIVLVVIWGIGLGALIIGGVIMMGSANWGAAGFGTTGLTGQRYSNHGFSTMSNGYNMMGGYR